MFSASTLCAFFCEAPETQKPEKLMQERAFKFPLRQAVSRTRSEQWKDLSVN
jgi:hypothetical protein